MKGNAKQVREKLKVETKITLQNFKKVCGLNGILPSQLPTMINRHKTTIYDALKNPTQYKPTMELLEKALPIREVQNV